jgi:hypothetical protein
MMNTEILLQTVYVAKENSPGSERSKTAMSFENLVKILPIGFESKNSIFDLVSFLTTLWCIFVALDTNIRKIE